MKTLFKSLKITLVFCVFFSVFYILILWLFAQVAGPNKGNAEVATLDGKVVVEARYQKVEIEKDGTVHLTIIPGKVKTINL